MILFFQVLQLVVCFKIFLFFNQTKLNYLIGLAVFLGIDDLTYLIQSKLKENKNQKSIYIAGIPDCGFFPNYDSEFVSRGVSDLQLRVGGPRYQKEDNLWYSDENDLKTHKNIYGTKMKQVFLMTGIGTPLNETVISDSNDSIFKCSNQMTLNPSNCIFPENLIKYINSPLFIIQVNSFYFFIFLLL